MAVISRENRVGAWAFFIGVMLAIVGGIILSFGYSVNPIILAFLSVLGLIAGFAVHVDEEVGSRFLMIAVALVIVSFAGQQGISSLSFGAIRIGEIISYSLAGLLILLVPATVVVAIKSLFSLARR